MDRIWAFIAVARTWKFIVALEVIGTKVINWVIDHKTPILAGTVLIMIIWISIKIIQAVGIKTLIICFFALLLLQVLAVVLVGLVSIVLKGFGVNVPGMNKA